MSRDYYGEFCVVLRQLNTPTEVPALQFDFFQSITIAAITNGLIFCVLLLRKKENRLANRFLSLLIFSICFSSCAQMWVDLRIYDRHPWLHWLPSGLVFLIGPSFYLYVRSLTESNFQFRRIHFWHFSWIIFNYFHSAYHLVYGRTVLHPKLHNFTEAMLAYAIFPLLVYVYLANGVIRDYRKALLDQFSSTESLTLNWLRQIMLMGAVVIATNLIFVVVDYKLLYDFEMEFFEGTLFQYDRFMYLLMLILTYGLSIGGFQQSQVNIDQNLSASGNKIEPKDYSSTLNKLIPAMQEEKLYLDPLLTIKKLSEFTGVSDREISTTINQALGKNFYAFVNGYRVEEVKQRLVDPQFAHLAILSIAFDAGFNSKPTFNRIFKEYTGQSPKAYRERTKIG